MEDGYFDKYLNYEMKVLVLGPIATSLVDRYRAMFIDICGQHDVEHPFVYRQELVDIHFPTDHFNTIIQISDLNQSRLNEVYRILKPLNKSGRFIWYSPSVVRRAENILIRTGFVIESQIISKRAGTIIVT